MSIYDGLDLLQSFMTVAEELNFRRAAERLAVDQSALSRRIQKLEHLVGFPLLERSTREVGLTAAGRVFYDANKGLLGGYARSVETALTVARGRSGLLSIAYMGFAAVDLMPRAVGAYRQLRPDVALNLAYTPTTRQKVLLANGEIDVGFMLAPVEHDDFGSVRLARDRLCVVAPPGDALLDDPVPERIAARPLILGDLAEWEFYRWHLASLFQARGLDLVVPLQPSNMMALIGLVRAGLGATILPEGVAPALPPGLAVRPIEADGFSIDTVLAWRRGDASPLVRDFVAMAARP